MLTHEPIVGHWYLRRDGVREKIVRKLDKNPEYPNHLWIATSDVDNPGACTNYSAGVTATGKFYSSPGEDPRDLVSIDPGDGYRLVEKGEVIEDGDEWADTDGGWKLPSRDITGISLAINWPLRRKIKVPAEVPAAPQQTEPEKYAYNRAEIRLLQSGQYLVQLFFHDLLVKAYTTEKPDPLAIGEGMMSKLLVRFPNLPPYNPITRV